MKTSLAVLLASAAVAHAQAPAWPERAVHLVVPSPPASGIDALARALAQHLGGRWGRPVVVENRPGANSIIGVEAVARAAPDGHTLLFASDAPFTINPHLHAALPYDPLRDFAPVTQVATFAQLLVAHPSASVRDYAQLVANAKAQPGRLAYASPGVGSAAQLMSGTLASLSGIELLHVPYKGFAPTVQAVFSGEVALAWLGVHSAREAVQAGRLHAIGVTGTGRSRFLPAVPTFAELGVAGLEADLWFGLFAPAATPAARIEALHHEVAGVLAEAQFRDRELLARGYEPSGIPPPRFAALLRREFDQRGAMARKAGMTR